MVDQVDFYILGATENTGKLKFACRVIQKAFSQNLKVYVKSADQSLATHVDTLLWTFSQGSFIPHTVVDSAIRDWSDYPVQLGYVEQIPEHGSFPIADVIINLCQQSQGISGEYPRVVEFVCNNPEDKQLGRERFRFYRDQGVEPSTHQINA